MDLIAANNLKVEGAGFGTDTNVLTLITEGRRAELARMSKEEAADELLTELLIISKGRAKGSRHTVMCAQAGDRETMTTVKVQKNQIIAKQKEKVKNGIFVQEGTVIQCNSYAKIVLGKNAVIGIS